MLDCALKQGVGGNFLDARLAHSWCRAPAHLAAGGEGEQLGPQTDSRAGPLSSRMRRRSFTSSRRPIRAGIA